jgi:hypothetical protein
MADKNPYASLFLRFRSNPEEVIKTEFTEKRFVTLEQKPIPKRDQYAGLYDAFEMIQMAQSGMTAFNYDLPGNVTIVGDLLKVDLDFFVWPHPGDMVFNAPSPAGAHEDYITLLSKSTETKSSNLVVPLQNYVQIPYGGTVGDIEWTTPCYNESGEELEEAPEILDVINGYVVFSKIVFGVIKITMEAVKYTYRASFYFEKTETEGKSIQNIFYNQVNHNQITNVECSVTVSHLDEEGEEKKAVLELEIPAYVLDYLEACPDGSFKHFWCDPADHPIVEHIKIYYSLCSGEVLETIREEVPNPCSEEE